MSSAANTIAKRVWRQAASASIPIMRVCKSALDIRTRPAIALSPASLAQSGRSMRSLLMSTGAILRVRHDSNLLGNRKTFALNSFSSVLVIVMGAAMFVQTQKRRSVILQKIHHKGRYLPATIEVIDHLTSRSICKSVSKL